MRLAIPMWNERVSPVFDAASRLVLIDIDQGAEVSRRIVEVGADPFPTQRVRRLTELRVTVLICGAISRPLAGFVSAAGIVLIPSVAGPVEDVLRAYLAGRLSEQRWLMPGCGAGGERHRGGRGWCRRRS